MIYLRKLVPVQRNVASGGAREKEKGGGGEGEGKEREKIWEDRREEGRISWESTTLHVFSSIF